jgi:hypothetical protein
MMIYRFELACLLVRLDHVASFINHSRCELFPQTFFNDRHARGPCHRRDPCHKMLLAQYTRFDFQRRNGSPSIGK